MIRLVQLGTHQLIHAVDLADTEPAMAVQIKQAVRQLPVAVARQLAGLHQRLRPVGSQRRQPPVLAPQASVGDPHQNKGLALHSAAQHTPAVVMHAAAQIDRGRGEFGWFQRRGAEGADQGCGASLLLRALLQPEQPDPLVRSLQQLRFLQAGKPADGDRCRKRGRSHAS